MAKKKGKSKGISDGLKKSVENYEHKGAKRLNNPPVGLVNTKTEKPDNKKAYKYDPHLSPQLQWAGKDERSQFEIPTVSLHVHERIDPKTIIEAVRSSDGLNWEQLNLFNRPINKLNFIKEIQFYQHEKDWSNRLIAGDSLLVMNSLIEKEGMAGKVQMIYFDPPYGIKYGSNFQPFVNKRDVKDGKDEDLNTEPETIRAFRDTWELGIHSYLSYMRDRLILARELLNEAGSIFIQISDENVHHVREIMDEVFGSSNFQAQINFKATSPLGSKGLAQVYDYIVWYAKDATKIKFRPIFKARDISDDTEWRFIDDPTAPLGYRRLTEDEFRGLPNYDGIFRRYKLTSSGFTPSCIFQFELNGKICKPYGGKSWATNKAGIETLIRKNRLFMLGDSPYFKQYYNDFPCTKFDNCWSDQPAAESRLYVVQTATKFIQRCMIMTTDPGDLVFDPTCGSGTTAQVAEQWGRRWITCDTSRIATVLAKQRLMTSTFPYYVFEHDEEGIRGGLKYKKIPHVTLKSIANNETTGEEALYDQPIVDTKIARVSGPFTVEAVPAPVVKQLTDQFEQENSLNSTIDFIRELANTGIRLNNKKVLKLSRLETLPGTRWLHAIGETDESPAQKIVVSFGPDFAPLEQKQVELALQEAEKIKPSPTIIVFAAFQFDPEAAKDIDEIEWGGVSVLKVQMNADLFTDDLKKKRSSNESFWLVGQPDIETEKIKVGEHKGKYKITVNGFDYYNTKTGAIESGGAKKIAMWLLDTDYDGRSIMPRQVFFPMADKDGGWSKFAKTLRAEIDEELIEAYRGTESLPFELGENKKVAIKIIDDRGMESLTIRELE